MTSYDLHSQFLPSRLPIRVNFLAYGLRGYWVNYVTDWSPGTSRSGITMMDGNISTIAPCLHCSALCLPIINLGEIF